MLFPPPLSIMNRRASLSRAPAGGAAEGEHQSLLAQSNPARRHLPKHAKVQLSIIEAEHLFESENNFDSFEPTRHTRFVALEFIGTYCHTLVSAGAIMSTGVLTYQFEMTEQTPGRMLAGALSQSFSYAACVYAARSFLDNKHKRRNEILRAAVSHEETHADQRKVAAQERFNSSHHKNQSYNTSFREYPVGYFNPAITLAMAIAKTRDGVTPQVTPTNAVLYCVVQVSASLCATYTLSAMYSHLRVPRSPLGVPVPGDGVTVVGTLIMEAILTFALALAMLLLFVRGEDTLGTGGKDSHNPRSFLKRVRESRGYIKDMAPLTIGLVHVALTIVGIPVSGASLNPARAFGCAAMSNTWTEHWAYWVGPFLGAGMAGFMFQNVISQIERV